MTIQEELEVFKKNYVPKEGYNIHVGITSSNKILGAVFAKVEIRSKKYGQELAECSVFNGKADTAELFGKMFDKYLTKRV